MVRPQVPSNLSGSTDALPRVGYAELASAVSNAGGLGIVLLTTT